MRGLRPDHVAMEAMNNTYERALVSMHKMPRIWLEYLEHLMVQRFATRTRRTYDRALASLPITQHDRIWQMYMVRGRGRGRGWGAGRGSSWTPAALAVWAMRS